MSQVYHTVCRNAGFGFIDQIISLLNLGPSIGQSWYRNEKGKVFAVPNSLLHWSFSDHQDNHFILDSWSALNRSLFVGYCVQHYCHRLPNEERGLDLGQNLNFSESSCKLWSFLPLLVHISGCSAIRTLDLKVYRVLLLHYEAAASLDVGGGSRPVLEIPQRWYLRKSSMQSS